MPIPQLNVERLSSELNSLRAVGRVISSELAIAKLKRLVEPLRTHDIHCYWAHLAAAECLAGNYGVMNSLLEKVWNGTDSARTLLHGVCTLMGAGDFKNAHKHIKTISLDVEEDAGTVAYAMAVGAFDYASSYVAHKEGSVGMPDSLVKTRQFLQEEGVEESLIVEMLDVAGAFLRGKGIIPRKTNYYPSSQLGSMTILLALNIEANEAASLEWELTEHLLAHFTPQTLGVVRVGFMGIQHAHN